jgi:1,4-dihydroxy-2-naphthoyl-CoA hydrolase
MRAPDIVRARMAIETPPPPQDGEAWLLPGFDRLYGLQITYITEDEARAHVVVRDELLQPGGLVHGGVFAAIAESLSSAATWYGVAREGKVAQGMSNQTSFLRPILAGTIHAVARRRHRGRTTWVWEVDILDDAERVCALVRMTVAVREVAA